MNHIKSFEHYVDENDYLTWVEITTECPVTGQKCKVSVKGDDFDKWQEGALVQEVFTYLSQTERELLVTGTSPEGWAMLFPS